MAMLEETPYRVYYLINNHYTVSDKYNSKCVWRSERISERGITGVENYYIDSELPSGNDFYSLKVRLKKVTRTVIKDSNNSLDDETERFFGSTPWNDLSDLVVSIINDFYDRSEETRRIRKDIVEYADLVQTLVEHPEKVIEVDLDDRGIPSIGIHGLPMMADPFKRLDLTIGTDESCNDCVLKLSYGMNEELSLTMRDLYDFKRKSDSYDNFCRVIHDAVTNY